MPRLHFQGEIDGYLWGWEVGSFTNPKVSYTVAIDMGSGEVRCDCMDASCRRNRSSRLNRSAPDLFGACKHARFILLRAKRELRERE